MGTYNDSAMNANACSAHIRSSNFLPTASGIEIEAFDFPFKIFHFPFSLQNKAWYWKHLKWRKKIKNMFV